MIWTIKRGRKVIIGCFELSSDHLSKKLSWIHKEEYVQAGYSTNKKQLNRFPCSAKQKWSLINWPNSHEIMMMIVRNIYRKFDEPQSIQNLSNRFFFGISLLQIAFFAGTLLNFLWCINLKIRIGKAFISTTVEKSRIWMFSREKNRQWHDENTASISLFLTL